MKRVLILLASFLCVAVVACGGNSYGSGSDFSKLKGNGSIAIQDPSPSPGASSSLGSDVPGGGGGGAGGPAPQQSAAAQAQAAHFAIAINSDSSGQPAFFPPAAQVYAGTIITFTNHDSVVRSVVSDPGAPVAFNSGPLAPGASWTFTAKTAGQYNYHDGTRPYAVADFKVLPH